MGKKDPRITDYIAEASPFARPILSYLREVVHEGCPDAVEVIKWHMPFYDYKGLLIGTPSFKAHCAVVFWRDIVIEAGSGSRDGRDQFGRITSMADLPSRAKLLAYVRSAVRQRDAGAGKPKRGPRKPAAEPVVPDDLKRALSKNTRARDTFRGFSPSHRAEYVEWITDAKQAETRARRLATTIEWLVEGKSRNWKYQ